MAICNKCQEYFEPEVEYPDPEDRHTDICPDCLFLGVDDDSEPDDGINGPAVNLLTPRGIAEANLCGSIEDDDEVEDDPSEEDEDLPDEMDDEEDDD